MALKPEYELCKQITRYLLLQYPKALFHWDYGSGAKLSMGQAVKMKQLNPRRGYPDLFIPEPRGCWHGLFIEVKAEGVKILNKKLSYKDEHLVEQAAYLEDLRAKGYMAAFGIGFDKVKEIIDNYFNGK